MSKDWNDGSHETPEARQNQPGATARDSMRGFDSESMPDRDFVDRQGRDVSIRTFKNGDSYYVRAYDRDVQTPPELRADVGQAGYANIRVEQHDEKTRARLQDIKVTPDYQECGTGSQLLNQAEQVAQQNQAYEIYGDAPPDLDTIQWYKQRGYQLRDGSQGGREVFKSF